MILAHWTYSRDEWKSFLFRNQKRKNIFQGLFNRARLVRKRPEVVFTPETVNIGGRQLDLRAGSGRIREISLYEEGEVNVMRFVLEGNEIRIPIPKGKLREALELRTRLTQ